MKIRKIIKKIEPKWLITTLIAIISLFLSITNKSLIRNCFGHTSIDFIKILPYEWSGYCLESKDDFLNTMDTYCFDTNIYNKACAIRVYLKNSQASVYRLSDMYINIEEIIPILHSAIDISAIVIDNCVYVYAINQGVEDVNDIEIVLTANYYENSSTPTNIYVNRYFDFNNCVSSVSIDCIQGGEIVQIFSFYVNNEGIDLLKQNIWLSLDACIISEKLSQDVFLGILLYYDEKVVMTKIEGDNHISATFFAFVDVNSGNGQYQIPMQVNPNIENEFNVGIDTIIIPNRSCDIKFSLIYKVGNDIIKTDSISTRILVPLYKDDYGYYDSLLIFCVENDILDYKKDTQPYVESNLNYDIYSILEEIE